MWLLAFAVLFLLRHAQLTDARVALVGGGLIATGCLVELVQGARADRADTAERLGVPGGSAELSGTTWWETMAT
jgi:hypothetical protein